MNFGFFQWLDGESVFKLATTQVISSCDMIQIADNLCAYQNTKTHSQILEVTDEEFPNCF